MITLCNNATEQKDTPHISVYNFITEKLENCTLKLPNHFEIGNEVKTVCLFNSRNSCLFAAAAFIRNGCTFEFPLALIKLTTDFVVLPQDETIHILY